MIAGTFTSQVLTAASGIMGARMLGDDGRGEVAMVMAISALVSQATLGSSLPVGIATGLSRSGLVARDGLRRLMPRLVLWGLVAAAGASAYLTLVSGDLPRTTRIALIVLVAIAALEAMAFRLLVGAMQGELASTRRMFAAALIAPALSTSLLAVAFISDWDWSAPDLLTAQAATWGLGLLLATRLLRKPAGGGTLEEGEVWRTARANYASAIGPIDGLALDRTIVASVMTTAATGLYAAATAFANLSSMVGTAIGVILLPRVSALSSRDQQRRLIRRWTLLAAVVITLGATMLVLVIGPLIRLAFGMEFAAAATAAAWLIVADAFLGFRRVLIAALQGLGRGARASWIETGLTPVVLTGVTLGALRGNLEDVARAMFGVAILSVVLLALALRSALADRPAVEAGSHVLLVELGGQGHRFYPVRLLAEEALDRGARVTVLTRIHPGTREHLEVHLGALLSRIEVIELHGPTWRDVERTSHDQGADLTVVTEADHYLVRLLLRAGWRGRGQLSLLVMRARVPDVGTPVRSAMANVVKSVIVTALHVLPRVRFGVLRSQLWRRRSIWPPVHDPATTVAGPADIASLRDAWRMDDAHYWVGVLGAVTENKNLPLVVDAVAEVARIRPVGLVVAGRVSPSLDDELARMQDVLEAAGVPMILHNRLLSEVELDAAVAAIDCMALAYSHNGPSGTFGKALLSGTRVVAAGSPALRTDAAAAPALSTWVPLTVTDVARAVVEAMDAPAPTPMALPGEREFTTALLGRAEEHAVDLQDPAV